MVGLQLTLIGGSPCLNRSSAPKKSCRTSAAGMDDAAIMEKYNLSAQGLQSAFNKLIAAGVLKQAELDQRTRPHEQVINTVWKCPACGKPQTRELEECPDCGVIAAKFLKRQEEKRNLELGGRLQQKKEKNRENKNEEAETSSAFCHKCGQSLHSEGLFCAHCGATIGAKQDQANECKILSPMCQDLLFSKAICS